MPPTVVTPTDFGPTAPAGAFTVIVVALTTDTSVHDTPPTVTVGAPPTSVKFVPAIVIGVPADSGPAAGETTEIVGAPTYVYPPAKVAAPPAVVTATSFTPTEPAGASAVRLRPSPATTTPVAKAAPNFTLVAPERFVPVIVTGTPAVTRPPTGVTPVAVGAAV